MIPYRKSTRLIFPGALILLVGVEDLGGGGRAGRAAISVKLLGSVLGFGVQGLGFKVQGQTVTGRMVHKRSRGSKRMQSNSGQRR